MSLTLGRIGTTLGEALDKDIKAFLEDHNDGPKPFVWTKTADQILDSVKRYAAKAGALRAEKAKRHRKR